MSQQPLPYLTAQQRRIVDVSERLITLAEEQLPGVIIQYPIRLTDVTNGRETYEIRFLFTLP